ncbi:unnamed protein product, partial [marine sediment metagenome]
MSVEYLNVTDAALYADVERITLYRWIQKGVTYRGQRAN